MVWEAAQGLEGFLSSGMSAGGTKSIMEWIQEAEMEVIPPKYLHDMSRIRFDSWAILRKLSQESLPRVQILVCRPTRNYLRLSSTRTEIEALEGTALVEGPILICQETQGLV